MSQIRSPKKLIEVALPLDDINVASAREKSIRHGHPSTLHLWWARRPLAAARAVIFAQMVNDPGGERGYYAGKTKAQADAEREELFQIMRDLVLWENTNNEEVLGRARAAIAKSWRETCELNKGKPGFDPEQLPAFHDPFAGGGALPLEAQRLGLESHASDLNPVAVTINKAMIEIPPRFAGRAPVGPQIEAERGTKKGTREAFPDWSGARGLAEDVRRYGAWMREQAQQRIGHLYPTVKITPEMIDASAFQISAKAQKDHQNAGLAGLQAGQELTVIAWLWARTVKSPNPAFSHVEVPLASSFILSSKAGKEAYVHPVIEGDSYRFEVRTGQPPESAKAGTTAGKRAGFTCLMSGSPIDYKYIRTEGAAGRLGTKLLAIVAEGERGRIYLAPTPEQEEMARQAVPAWRPETTLPDKALSFRVQEYGMLTWGELFTPRQLVALTTFSDLVPEAIARIRADALAADMADDGRGLDAGGNGATAYAEAVGVYLALGISRLSDAQNALCQWGPSANQTQHLFRRQAVPMVWDYAESSVFSGAAGDLVPNSPGGV
jgi:putative DNA methylase